MSTGVVESLALERAEGGAALLVISGGGIEDMVVEGRPARETGHRRWVLNEWCVRWGEEDAVVAPTPNHVAGPNHFRITHALDCLQRDSIRETSDASVTNQPIDVPQPGWG